MERRSLTVTGLPCSSSAFTSKKKEGEDKEDEEDEEEEEEEEKEEGEP